MAHEIKRFSQAVDLLGFMVLACGNRFPKVGPYGDDLAANNAISFARLRTGLPIIFKKLKNEATEARILSLVDEAERAYEAQDRTLGSSLLQQIEDLVCPTRFKDYEARKNGQQ
jgi:hypothetical protein